MATAVLNGAIAAVQKSTVMQVTYTVLFGGT
jgi:hypothetical protein